MNQTYVSKWWSDRDNRWHYIVWVDDESYGITRHQYAALIRHGAKTERDLEQERVESLIDAGILHDRTYN